MTLQRAGVVVETVGTSRRTVTPEVAGSTPAGHPRALSGATVAPRLLNLRAAANYCGISYWTMRDLVLQNQVPRVILPGQRPREGARGQATLRRVLIDRADLDAKIEEWKAAA